MTHADGCPAAHNPRHGCACATPTVHAGPEDGSAVTPCCGRSPFELPLSDRMTYEPALVTCTTETSSTDVVSSYPPPRVLPTSVAPAGEDHGAPIWRWKVPSGYVDYHGAGPTDVYVEVVTHADHLAAVAAAEQRGYGRGLDLDYDDRIKAAFDYGREYQQQRLTNHDMHSGLACLTNYEQGQRDEREACIAAVEGCKWADFGIDPTDYDMDGDYWRDQAAAAIRAREEKP